MLCGAISMALRSLFVLTWIRAKVSLVKASIPELYASCNTTILESTMLVTVSVSLI